MADITMCLIESKNCNKSDTCYRKLATRDYYQSFSSFGHERTGKEVLECKYYIRADKK